jgi:long-subunit fatty acid transport protein
VLFAAGPARAQSTAQIPLQFDFMNPGARSLGLGGAFIAAADDATAAFANPAGLALLSTREVSAEGRFRSVETRFLQRGRVSGVATNIGADTIAGVVYGTDIDRQTGPTFVSIVVPIRRVTLAGYRHEVVTLENTFLSEGVFERATFAGITDDRNRESPLGGTRTVRIRNYGGAAGYKVSDRFSLGGGLSAYTFSLESDFARFGFASTLFGPIDQSIRSATATQRGNDTAVAANVGALWTVRPGLKVGGMFRRGPRFSFTQDDRILISGADLHRSGHFKVPDVWGAGVEWRASESLRVVADYDRVRYSQLKKDFVDFQAISSGRVDQLRIDDGHEVHVGLEYLLLGAVKPLAFRAGAWFDPDHAVRYVPTSAADRTDVLLSATLPGGKNLVHGTFGAGVAVSRWLEVNAAADFSSQTTYATASAVVRF